MAKFRYRMQNILEIKYKLETQAKSNYSIANDKLQSEQRKLESLHNDVKNYEKQIREICSQKFDLLEVRRCLDSIEIKKIHIKTQIQEVNKAKKNLELARLRLSEVMLDRKTHEKLKDREFEEYVRAINEKEMKEIDELVSYSYNKVYSR